MGEVEDGRFFTILPINKRTERSSDIENELGYWVHGSVGSLYYRNMGFL